MAGMPPEAQPQAAAPQGAPAEGGGSPEQAFQELVTGISDGFAMLSSIAQEISPDGAQKLSALNDQYQSIIQEIMAGGQGAPAGPGMASPEAGGSGAVPMSHGMKRG
jgi:hypothetical protein